MTKQFRLNWFCVHCDKPHALLGELKPITNKAYELLLASEALGLSIEDETMAKELDLDEAERAALSPGIVVIRL